MKSLMALSLITGLTFSMLPVSAQLEDMPPAPDGAPPVAMVPLDGPGAALPMHGSPMAGKPKFSNEQLEKFYNLKNNLLDQIGPKKAELKKHSRHLKDLLTQDTLDRSSIKSTQDQINSLKADIANLSLSFKMDFNEALTPEQRQSIRYRKMKPRRMRGHKRHRRPMRRGFNGQNQRRVIGQFTDKSQIKGGLEPGLQALQSAPINNLEQVSESI